MKKKLKKEEEKEGNKAEGNKNFMDKI